MLVRGKHTYSVAHLGKVHLGISVFLFKSCLKHNWAAPRITPRYFPLPSSSGLLPVSPGCISISLFAFG